MTKENRMTKIKIRYGYVGGTLVTPCFYASPGRLNELATSGHVEIIHSRVRRRSRREVKFPERPPRPRTLLPAVVQEQGPPAQPELRCWATIARLGFADRPPAGRQDSGAGVPPAPGQPARRHRKLRRQQ